MKTVRIVDLVAPLAKGTGNPATDMRTTDTAGLDTQAASGAASPLSNRQGGVDSANKRSTRTIQIVPGIRASTTVTRTTTTRTTSSSCEPSADEQPLRYVDDMVLLHESPLWLNAAHADINEWLPQNLGLRLNPSKIILQPIERGVDFVGQVIKPWRRYTRRRTFNEAISRAKQIPADELFETANSYFGLLRQASHSHRDRIQLANVLRYRGHCINKGFTKVFRKSKTTNGGIYGNQ